MCPTEHPRTKKQLAQLCQLLCQLPFCKGRQKVFASNKTENKQILASNCCLFTNLIHEPRGFVSLAFLQPFFYRQSQSGHLLGITKRKLNLFIFLFVELQQLLRKLRTEY